MDFERVTFSGHAIRRMFERSITRREVIEALQSGETIAEYPDDHPYPSCILLSATSTRPLHVVVARGTESGTVHVITTYDPDPKLWDDEFKRRRRP